jgi:hypothetical protein
MRKAEALQKTRERFTNLLDGKILPRYSVTDIIVYYETLIAKNAAPVINRGSGIVDNFIEEQVRDYEEDDDYC